MKISELVKKLEELKKQHGDVPVVWQSLSHTWPPEPTATKRVGSPVILLNP